VSAGVARCVEYRNDLGQVDLGLAALTKIALDGPYDRLLVAFRHTGEACQAFTTNGQRWKRRGAGCLALRL
jgi:hypothetical protein